MSKLLEQTPEWMNRVEVRRGRILGLSIETVPLLLEPGVFQFRSVRVKVELVCQSVYGV